MFERANERLGVECLLAGSASGASCRRYGNLGEVLDEVLDKEVFAL